MSKHFTKKLREGGGILSFFAFGFVYRVFNGVLNGSGEVKRLGFLPGGIILFAVRLHLALEMEMGIRKRGFRQQKEKAASDNRREGRLPTTPCLLQ
jgi:hypothetical protein